MKILIFLFIPFFITAQKVKLKKKEVPAEIVLAFQNRYLNAKKTKWSKIENDYVATFLSDKHIVRVTYNAAGEWKQNALQMKMKDVPLKVFMGWFQGFYADWMPRRIEKIETPDTQPVYLLEVHQNDLIREIIYDENGMLLKEIIVRQ